MSGNFSGNRFKCLRCYDFDLCQACFMNNRFANANIADGIQQMHAQDHPMQLIMTQRDFEVVYEGDSSKNYDTCRVASFTCPYCAINGFSLRSFANHIVTSHPEPPNPRVNVICPMCIACPEFDANREIDHLKTHWTAFHANLETATYRAEPTRAAARRPMLARRTARQPAGNANANSGVASVAAPSGTSGVTASFGLPPWTADIADVDEMFRMVNLTRHLPPLPNIPITAEMQRLGTTLFQPGANGASLLPTLRSTVHRGSEYAQPRNASTARQTPVNSGPVQQAVRPLRVVPVYPPATDQSQSASPDDFEPFDELTEDDSSDIGTFAVDDNKAHYDTDNDPSRNSEQGIENTVLSPGLNHGQIIDSDSEFEFASLEDSARNPIFFVISIRFIYYFRTVYYYVFKTLNYNLLRKMHRELSMASSMECTLEKTELSLAVIRAACGVTPKGKEYDKPDQSLRRTLRHLDIPRMESPSEGVNNSTDSREDVLVEASRRLESESERVAETPASGSTTEPICDQLPPTSTAVASDEESSGDEDGSNHSGRQDVVEFLADAESRN
uniref:RING-type E3 ubiquitin transferase n=1 Tax=Heterorhabditis bacteriophora TaxID=37862 RepID=A0A1I7XSC9_HETBA